MMEKIFDQIIKKIKRRTNSFNELDLIKGLKIESINKLEELLEVKFPKDFRCALSCYGKTLRHPNNKDMIISIPLPGDMGLTSENQIKAIYKLLKTSNYKQIVNNKIETSEKYLWYPKWIPIAAKNRTTVHDTLHYHYDMLILDPDSIFYNHVFSWTRDKGLRYVLANSFNNYIKEFNRNLDIPESDEVFGFSLKI